VGLLSVLSFVGVLFRETVLLAPAAAFAAGLLRRTDARRRLGLVRRAVPPLGGLAAVATTHAIVAAQGEYSYAGQVLRMMRSHWQDPLAALLTPFAVFGPVLLLPVLYCHGATAAFCRRFPVLLLYGLGVFFTTFLGGHHGVRLLFGAIAAVLPLVGVVLAQLVRTGPPGCWLCVLVPLFAAQALASNLFAPLPDYPGIAAPATPAAYAFFPYGRGARYSHLPPTAMSAQLRGTVLLQYGALAAYLVCLRAYGLRRGWLR
jgi:hypothetical protein